MKLLVIYFLRSLITSCSLIPNILESETSLIGRKECQYLLVSRIELAFLAPNELLQVICCVFRCLKQCISTCSAFRQPTQPHYTVLHFLSTDFHQDSDILHITRNYSVMIFEVFEVLVFVRI
jgi:hypothetical protein